MGGYDFLRSRNLWSSYLRILSTAIGGASDEKSINIRTKRNERGGGESGEEFEMRGSKLAMNDKPKACTSY